MILVCTVEFTAFGIMYHMYPYIHRCPVDGYGESQAGANFHRS